MLDVLYFTCAEADFIYPYFFCLPSLYLCTNQQTRQVCVLCFSVNLIMLEMQYKLFPTK